MSGNQSRFGAELPQFVWRTLHPSSLFVGAALGGVGAGAVFLLGVMEAPKLMPTAISALLFLSVARFANSTARTPGVPSPWSAPGTSWPDDFAALGRVFLLNLLWLIPMAVVSPSMGPVQAGGGFGLTATLVLAASLVLPPLFLLVGIGADRVTDIFSPDHWRATIRGRQADIVTLFFAYIGTAGMCGGLAIAFAVALGSGKAALTIFLCLVAGAYGVGVTSLLLGRLIGSFLRDLPSELEEWTPEDPVEAPTHAPQAPTTPRRLRDGLEVDEDVDIDGLFEGADDEDGSFHVDHPAAAQPMAPPVRPEPSPVRPAPSGGSVTAMLSGVKRTAKTDPARALNELQTWASQNTPHPLVTAHIAVLKKRLDESDALATAQAAVEQGRAMNSVGALNEVYAAFKSQEAELGLEPDDWQRMAAALTSLGNPSRAVELYGKVLEAKPDSMPSWKGLIQIADDYLKFDDGAEKAILVYDLLDRLAPDHPFGDFVERGRETAERRLQKTR